jgi:hypothetical protein
MLGATNNSQGMNSMNQLNPLAGMMQHNPVQMPLQGMNLVAMRAQQRPAEQLDHEARLRQNRMYRFRISRLRKKVGGALFYTCVAHAHTQRSSSASLLETCKPSAAFSSRSW